jgi:coniferyl-aldehyde dehydrogenase
MTQQVESSTSSERSKSTSKDVDAVNAAPASDARPEVATSEAPPKSLRELFLKIRSAQRAQVNGPSYEERLDHLDRLERVILKSQDALAEAISQDFGHRSTHETRMAEVFIVLAGLRHAREHLADWMAVESREVAWTFAPGSAQVMPQPLGVVGIIAPWNYPMQLALAPLVQAIAAGNRALIKPSELTPKTGEVLKRIVSDAFAYDHVSVVTGEAELGAEFAALPFDHLIFTGSTRVGKLVMKAASENLVPVTLELGGKSPCIVGPGFPLASAAKSILSGKLLNAGQTCIAPDYLLVPEDKIDAMVAALKDAAREMFPSYHQNPDYTSIINQAHFDRLLGYVQDAEEKGAKIVPLSHNGDEHNKDGNRKFIPTLVTGAKDSMRVMEEEIFGPILPILPYKTLDDAIGHVNERPRPLALYAFDRNELNIEKILAETISGGVTINDVMLHIAQDTLPFGGVGPSGMGHYHGREGFLAMSKMKPVFRQARFNATSLLRQPFGKRLDWLLKFLIGS